MFEERRKNIRVRLRGPFHHMLFTVNSNWISPDAFDASPIGLGLVIPEAQSPGPNLMTQLKISFDDDRPSVVLELRFAKEFRNKDGSVDHYRCGFELSQTDKKRGINLIQLMRGSVEMHSESKSA